MVGTRPFATGDQSRNVNLLALVSLGESWHNLHHAYRPALGTSARPAVAAKHQMRSDCAR
jgi:fatty-acid desaturase